VLTAFLFLLSALAPAQTAPSLRAPAIESPSKLPLVPPRLVSPDVHSDGRVTFRVLDPSSREIFLRLEGAKPVIMQKDDLGVWRVTTAPLQPVLLRLYLS
jgi:hypothetical protein